MFDIARDLNTMGPALARPSRDLTDAERFKLLGSLEGLKASAAAQARLTADLNTSQRQTQADAGLPARRRGDHDLCANPTPSTGSATPASPPPLDASSTASTPSPS